LKNFKKYLLDAILKRTKCLEHRSNKLEIRSSQLLASMTSNDISSDFEYKIEEEAPFNDNKAAQIELQEMMKSYVPRTSENKYSLNPDDEQQTNLMMKPMKIDDGIKKLEIKRESNKNKITTKHTIVQRISRNLTNNKMMNAFKENKNDPQDLDVDDIELEDDDKKNKTEKKKEIEYDIQALLEIVGNTPMSMDGEEEKLELQHIKNTEGTEIFTPNAPIPRKSDIVVIDEKQIKNESEINIDLSSMQKQISDQTEKEKEEKEQHQTTDTVVVALELKQNEDDKKEQDEDSEEEELSISDKINEQNVADTMVTQSMMDILNDVEL